MEYVIYVRQSSDEGSGKQRQSMPDQIGACLKYAEANDLTIMKAPKKPRYEDKERIRRQEVQEASLGIDIYTRTRGLYIIKEDHSAKKPRGRKKRNRLIELVNS